MLPPWLGSNSSNKRGEGEDSRTFRLRVAYDGTGYAGFQRQPRQPTVQAAIEDALWRFTAERITIRYAGRTDAGVHAEGQVIAFETSRELDASAVLAGLNTYLPPSIVAWEATAVAPGYHPRRSALSRCYRYQVWQGAWPSPFLRRYSWHVRDPLDLAAMERAAAPLLGEHDFAAFAQRSGAAVKSTVRRVDRIELRRAGPLLLVEVEANAFLPHMVRTIVGTLVWVGRGRLAVSAVEQLLTSRDRREAGPSAPGHGLFLAFVRLADDLPGRASGAEQALAWLGEAQRSAWCSGERFAP